MRGGCPQGRARRAPGGVRGRPGGMAAYLQRGCPTGCARGGRDPDRLPLTPTGKVDGARSPHPTPPIGAATSSPLLPRSARRAGAAAVWPRCWASSGRPARQLLRLGAIWIERSRIRCGAPASSGIALTPRQMFQHQTLAELPPVAGTAEECGVRSGPVTGPVPLLPIQRWVRAGPAGAPPPEPVDAARAAGRDRAAGDGSALRALATHHDVLRSRFRRATTAGSKQIAPRATRAALLGRRRPQARSRARTAAARRGVDAGRLLLAIHTCGRCVSWRSCSSIWRGPRASSAATPCSCGARPRRSGVAERLAAYAQGDGLRSGRVWEGARRPAALAVPTDSPGQNRQGSARQVTVELDEDETAAVAGRRRASGCWPRWPRPSRGGWAGRGRDRHREPRPRPCVRRHRRVRTVGGSPRASRSGSSSEARTQRSRSRPRLARSPEAAWAIRPAPPPDRPRRAASRSWDRRRSASTTWAAGPGRAGSSTAIAGSSAARGRPASRHRGRRRADGGPLRVVFNYSQELHDAATIEGLARTSWLACETSARVGAGPRSRRPAIRPWLPAARRPAAAVHCRSGCGSSTARAGRAVLNHPSRFASGASSTWSASAARSRRWSRATSRCAAASRPWTAPRSRWSRRPSRRACRSPTSATCRRTSGTARRRPRGEPRPPSHSTWPAGRWCAGGAAHGRRRARARGRGHHIVADGWSGGSCSPSWPLYAGEALAPLRVQYADYAAWARERMAGERLEARAGLLARGARRRASADRAADRPAAPARPVLPRTDVVRTLRAELVTRVRALCRARGATRSWRPGAFDGWSRGGQDSSTWWSGHRSVGARARARSGRGPFLNTVALRVSLDGEPGFAELVGRVARAAVDAVQHQEVPFEKVLERIAPPRDLARTPVFQLFFNMLNYPALPALLPGLGLEVLSAPLIPSKFDLTVYAHDRGEAVELQLVYNADLFDRGTIAELADQYERLLEQCVADPTRSVHLHSLVTDRARGELPDPTWTSMRRGRADHDHCRGSRAAPGALALVDRGGTWTYGSWKRPRGPRSPPPSGRGRRRRRDRDLGASIGGAGVGGPGGSRPAPRCSSSSPAYPGGGWSSGSPWRGPGRWSAYRGEAVRRRGRHGWTLTRLPVRRARRSPGPATPWAGESTEPLRVPVGPTTPRASGSRPIDRRREAIVGLHRSLTHFVPWQARELGSGAGDRFTMLSGLRTIRSSATCSPRSSSGRDLHPRSGPMSEPGWLAGWAAAQRVTIANLHRRWCSSSPRRRPGAGRAARRQPAAGVRGGDVLRRRDVARLRAIAPAVVVVNLYGTTEPSARWASRDRAGGTRGRERRRRVAASGAPCRAPAPGRRLREHARRSARWRDRRAQPAPAGYLGDDG